MTSSDVLYLSTADVLAVNLAPQTARAAILAAFRAHHAAQVVTMPKTTLAIGPGHAFQSMCAAWSDEGLAANKWLGTATPPPGSGQAAVQALIVLNDHTTGQVRAIMDGNVVTAIRTAALSAAAAQSLARPGSRSIGFIGCGLQARAHLTALRALLPGLTQLHAFSRTRQSAAAFVAVSNAAGLPGTIAETAEAVVRAADIVVSSVPMEAGFRPFLDPAWIRPGAFVTSVDIGRSWLPGGLRALDILAIDDHAQQAANPPIAPGLGPRGSFDVDLSELAAGTGRTRQTATERTMFIFRGHGVADLAVAAQVYAAAKAAGIGQWLPR